MTQLDLEPGVRIGPIFFGAQIDTLSDNLEYLRTESDAAGTMVVYGIVGESGERTLVYVEDDIVEWVSCRRLCSYRGVNLVGASVQEASDLFNDYVQTYEREDTPLGEYEIFRYDAAGIALWSLDGVVRIVDVNEI